MSKIFEWRSSTMYNTMSSDREGEPHDPDRPYVDDPDHETSGPLNEDPGNHGFSEEEYEYVEYEEDIGGKDELGEDTPEEPPMTPQEEAREIERLIASMKDCSDVMGMQNTQAVKKIIGRRYPEEAYRLNATSKVRRIIQSQSAPLVAKHHKHPYKRYASVSDRLDALNQAYRDSKDVVKMDMDPVYGDKLCDNPELALRSKKNNRKLNNQRNLEVKIGKKELEKQQKMFGSGDDDDGDVPKPTTSTKKQIPKKTPANASPAKVTPAKRRPTTIKKERSSCRQLRSIRAKDEDEYQDETPSKKRRQNTTSRRTTTNNNGADNGAGPCQFAMHPAIKSELSSLAVSPGQYPFHLDDPSSHLDHVLEAHYGDLSLPRLEAILWAQGRECRSPAILAEITRRYRNIMLDLLGINESAIQSLTYRDLRTYARAYYYPLRNVRWHSRYLTAAWPTARANLVFSPDGFHNTHFANAITRLRPIAIARGDLTSDGVMNPFNYLRMTTDQEDRAIGLVDNPLDNPLDVNKRLAEAALRDDPFS